MTEPKLDLSPSPGDDVKTTTCYMCACRCGIKVWLKDGAIRYIQGNPAHPVNRGVLCAKGSSGIMQHYSPARLRKPLLRVGERGAGQFREIEWDEALSIATKWLGDIRARNPDELAFFTGRDQSQALTGWWAQAFGTINYAAHGGFCSVNMAAGGLYTLGGSFWEFGEPDWEHTQYLMLWGVAEDHDSNPIKLGLGKLKARGAKIVAVNPVRSGYGALADEWIGIRPGSDGLFAFALIHELLRADRIDLDYLVRYANAHWLVIDDPGAADDGLFARDAQGRPLCWDRAAKRPHPSPPPQAGEGGEATGQSGNSDPPLAGRATGNQSPHEKPLPPLMERAAGSQSPHEKPLPPLMERAAGSQSPHEKPLPPLMERAAGSQSPHEKPLPPLAGEGGDGGVGALAPAESTDISPAVIGEYTLADGRRAVPVFHLLAQRYLDPQYSPDAVAQRCGIPADTIRRIARELAHAAFDSGLKLPIPWTDIHGRHHAEMIGRPVAMHAMRGIAAHANGFHTCRALHVLQMLLGAIDAPGSFRYQPPYPRPIPPAARPAKGRRADGTLDGPPLGFIHGPEDLVVDADGQPRRIDHAYSWAYPLALHGMMHAVIRNAWAGNPRKIDTLMMFMANMSWNSSMNTGQTMHMLTDKDAAGDYKIPRIIYADAYASEMVAYADLVLPDTTYLERHDCISLLDRPISDADCAADAIRHPIFDPATQNDADGRPRDVRGFQSVLLDLGARLKLPGMVDAAGAPIYRDYADYMVNHQRAPGVGLLAGWRGADGMAHGKGPPNPKQLEAYIAHGGFWHAPIPESARYYKMANRDYLEWSAQMGFIGRPEPVVLQLYSEVLQKFRLAARGHGPVQPPERERARVERYFDPLPIWYEPCADGSAGRSAQEPQFPLSAVTQRPMFMYHAWGSQNAWLRQIATDNALYLHPDTAAKYGIADGELAHLDSHLGRMTVPVRCAGNVQPDTVWTWNAIGKRRGAWRLAPDAPEGRRGFLLNHLIGDLDARGDYFNADPVTGQAAWFDLRVRISPASVAADAASEPQYPTISVGNTSSDPLRYGARFRSRP